MGSALKNQEVPCLTNVQEKPIIISSMPARNDIICRRFIHVEDCTAMEEKEIPKAVISRLPKYYRYLGILMDEGVERVSSADLSRHMHATASQIRQDLNHFGGFGQQGYGYNVKYLYESIGKILGLDRGYTMIIVGAGRIGMAVASYTRFEKRGFKVIGIFDRRPENHRGENAGGIEVRGMDELPAFLRQNKPDIAALTMPSEGAAMVAPILIKGGVKGIWNFSHMDLEVPEDVTIQDVHLSESLMELGYRMNHPSGGQKASGKWPES